MLSAQKRFFGETGDEESYNPYTWVSKPHFYYQETPYYNYPYIIGRLTAYELYGSYLDDGVAFWDRFLKVLKQSGKTNVSETLNLFGINDNNCWQKALKSIDAVVQKWNDLKSQPI
jgi:oligoendopeptidase F